MINKVILKATQSRFVQGIKRRSYGALCNSAGMELVQVAILVAIAIVIGLIFREQIEKFVKEIFEKLSSGSFQ